MNRLETDEAERAALHALLFEHREGLALADVAVELGLTETRAEELLRAQERRELVRSEVDEREGVLRYVTLRVSAPSIDARAARAALAASRAAVRDGAARVWRIVATGLLTALLAMTGWFAIHRTDVAATEARPSTYALASGDEHASARHASSQHRAWKAEADDLTARLGRLDGDARSNDCAARWTSGKACYVSHRSMTRPVFDAERARMTLRDAELRRLLEESR